MGDGRVRWVEMDLKRPLTDAEAALVQIVCDGFDTGPWNLGPWDTRMRSEGRWAGLYVTRDLSTYDTDSLTRLVFAAHERCCRVEIDPAGPRGVRVCVSRRSREGGYSERHPTIETALATWRMPSDVQDRDAWVSAEAKRIRRETRP